MTPLEQADAALSDARRAHGRLQAALDALRAGPEPAEFRPTGFACVVERAPEGVTLVVRMASANISLPLPADRARELASLLLVQAEPWITEKSQKQP